MKQVGGRALSRAKPRAGKNGDEGGELSLIELLHISGSEKIRH
jgi:hypothetical protein